MQGSTPLEPICAICHHPITTEQRPYNSLPSGEHAHLACYLNHMDDDEKKPAS